MAPCCPLGARLLFFPGGRKNLSCRAHPMGHPGRWIFSPGKNFICMQRSCHERTRSVPGMKFRVGGRCTDRIMGKRALERCAERKFYGRNVCTNFLLAHHVPCMPGTTDKAQGTNTSASVFEPGALRGVAFERSAEGVGANAKYCSRGGDFPLERKNGSGVWGGRRYRA